MYVYMHFIVSLCISILKYQLDQVYPPGLVGPAFSMVFSGVCNKNRVSDGTVVYIRLG